MNIKPNKYILEVAFFIASTFQPHSQLSSTTSL